MTQPPNNRWWNQGWFPGLLLAAATLIAYQPAWHAGFIWDDDDYVTHNTLLTAPDGLKRIWFSQDSPSQYFPLVYTAFRLERALWGLNPAGYHWVNILLHAANALLAWRLLKRLSVPGAWLAAAIFALHPVNVESVAWITQLKNVLSLFFCLLALLAWVEFVEEPTCWRWYGLTLLFYVMALSSKTTACTLPAALLLILWLKQKPVNWSRLAQVVPFVALGVGMGLVSMWWEQHHQGTEGAIYAIGPLERVLVAGRAVWFYAGKLIWPANLTFNYPLWKIHPADPLAYGWLAAGAGLGAVIYFARRFVGRSVEVAAVFYMVTLSPLLGFIMLYTFRYTFVADHYQYAACLGPMALAAAGISTASWLSEERRPFLKPAFCGGLLVVLGVLTWRQCGMYADPETLWRTTIARNPNSSMAHNNLGVIYFDRGRVDEAMAYCRKALEIQPDSANAHFNLGRIFLRQGRLDEAAAHFQRALEIQPNDARAHSDLGLVLLQKGQTDEAMAHCLKALEIQPDFAEAHYNFGNALLQKGQLDEAIVQFQKALEIQPDSAEARNNLGWVLLQNGRLDEAIAHFQTALKIQPGFTLAHGNLAMALIRNGQAREAIAQYESILKLQPDNADALSGLAWVLATWPEASVRNGSEAMRLAERANQLTGGQDFQTLRTLAAAYAEGGQFAEAVTTAQQALQLADSQSNGALVEALRSQLKSYQAGSPFRDPGPTNAPANRNQSIRPQ
jgi:protein O-mannosyl-transferase